MYWGVGFRVQGLGFKVWGLGLRVTKGLWVPIYSPDNGESNGKEYGK